MFGSASMPRSSGFLASVFLFGLCVNTVADEPDKDMSAELAEICRKHDLPAMAAAVVNSDDLVQSCTFGVRKRQSSDETEVTDRFPIGSNTKSMTAALAAVMVEQNTIQWNTTIAEVWPESRGSEIHPELRNVTLDQLLSHQSGLARDISDISKDAWVKFFAEKHSPVIERQQMLKLILPLKPPNQQGNFAYSNIGYAVAAAMLETRGEEPYESLMKKFIFVPLEMESADFRTLQGAEKSKQSLMWGHQGDGTPVDPRTAGAENPTVYAASGTVHLCIEDYAKFARWHLAGKPAPVLQTQAAFNHLHKAQIDYEIAGAKYACGWVCVDTAYGPALTHTGSNTLAFALIWIIPEANFAGVLCTNTGQTQAFAACNEMMTVLIAKYATEKSLSTPSPSKAKPKNIDPKRLVGRYQLAPNFIFDVKQKDDHLLIGITNQPAQEVFPDSPTVWSYQTVEASLEFHIGEKGQAYALTLHQNGIKQKAKRLKD